ncbi:cytosolic phospholipase A2 gamma-like isoform X3 [Hyperolius riggenbachi]
MDTEKKYLLLEEESEGEALSVKARQRKIKETLSSLGMEVAEDSSPPVIAVMGSGGGLRAMVAFLGTLSKLAEVKLLDATTYVCGTSGSTWCLSSLYGKKWSDFEHLNDMEHQLLYRLKSPWDWRKALYKLKEAFSDDNYSLTHFWAYVVVHRMINDINEGKLSSHKEGCENGDNPYPIYSAVEKKCLNKNDEGAWFQFTPHICGFPAYRSFIQTEFLGSKFEAGNLKMTRPEEELCYLQGLWGSALASDNVGRDILQTLFQHVTLRKPKGLSLLAYSDKIDTGLSLLGNSDKIATASSCSCPSCVHVKRLLSQDLDGMPDEEHAKYWTNIDEALEAVKIGHKSMDVTFPVGPGRGASRFSVTMQPEGSHILSAISEISEEVTVLQHLARSFRKWKWGTTHNFLYRLDHVDSLDGNSKMKSRILDHIPTSLFSTEDLSLIDSGLEINTAFPLMLPPNRKVDLILSFDFSEGDPFLTIKKTAEYCEKNKIPFPEINKEDLNQDIPSKNFYIFEGDGNETPDVMHFPLFNNETCQGKVEQLRETYSTSHLSYNESKLQELIEISKNNVEKSKDQILERIKLCVQRCNQKTTA